MATSHRAPRVIAAEPVPSIPDRMLRIVLLGVVVAGGAFLFAISLLPTVGAAGRGVQRFTDEFNGIGADIEVGFPDLPERSTIYAADGTLLATVYLDENRKLVKSRQVNNHTKDAILAIEDARFYEHPGLDARGIVRAFLKNLGAGEILEGASTLTQQLARNVFPEDVGTEKTLARKIAEARVAMRIEQEHTKDEILELYLNEVYMGRSVYGIGAASEFYFGKRPKRLTLAESATLAGLIAAPERYSPVIDPEAARERRNTVLTRMEELGSITLAEAAEARGEPLELNQKVVTAKRRFPFFVELVRTEILDLENHEYDALFGTTKRQRERRLGQGGFEIHTTLKPGLQREGQRIAEEWLPTPDHPESALASVEPETGKILALPTSQRFDDSQVDLATGAGGSGRQSGSAFKMFTLVAAFEQGIPPSTVYNGAHRFPVKCPDGQTYEVPNADGSSGHIDLWGATSRSVNAVFVQLSVDAGLGNVAEVARRMGIQSPLSEVCSLSLGVNEVTPLEMASAYATLANEGVRCEPYSIQRIVDRGGDVRFRQKKDGRCEEVVDPDIAALTVNLLEGVVSGGTGTRANLGTWPVFGKTGSTNDLADAWFVGCTKQICTASWVGHPQGLIPMSNVSPFGRVFGGTAPAQIWHDYMMVAMQGLRPIGFPGVPQISWPTATVPDVVGMSEEEASSVLSQAGFRANPVQADSSQPAGTVVGQSPGGGAEAPLGSGVTIQVSTGKPATVTVPDVVGMTESQAVRAIRDAGFEAAVSYEATDRQNLHGIVGAQSPGAGAEADQGATVSITVYEYEEPKEKPKKPKEKPKPPPGEEPSE